MKVYQFYNPYSHKYQMVSPDDRELIWDYTKWSRLPHKDVPEIDPMESKYGIHITRNFLLHELVCKCGCGYFPYSREFMNLYQNKIRTPYGKPITVMSGGRCPRHNASFSNNPDSDHVHGCAIDNRISNARDRYLIQRIAYRTEEFTRIAYNSAMVHIGVGRPMGKNDPQVTWPY